jgi:hypothetical protein
LLQQYEQMASILTVSYVNSADQRVVLGFDEIARRLFDLSFDPYHAIEYRWGARGEELASARDGETKRRFYDLERRLRNQLERVYNQATPLGMGTDVSPSVDVRGWLESYLQGHNVDRLMLAFNTEVVAPMPEPSNESISADAIVDVMTDREPIGDMSSSADQTVKTAPPAQTVEKTSDERKEDFWSDLMLAGDQLAAAFIDTGNYSKQNFAGQ